MNREARDKRPNLRPVEKIELSEKNLLVRLILVLVLITIAGVAIYFGVNGLLAGNAGWTEIDASSSSQTNCSDEFVFQYEVGTGEKSASVEKKALIQIYSQATETAYQLFQESARFDDVHNVAYINQHPNEEIEVDPVLYAAFEKLEKAGNRYLYLGTLYEYYDSIFRCDDLSQTVEYDPVNNEEIQGLYRDIVAYGSNPEMIDLELLGENRVMLKVAKEYLDFCKEEELHSFIHFYWMKNAFITDYLADTIAEKGFTKGIISSDDGYTRNLDTRGVQEYSMNLFDRVDTNIYGAGVMRYQAPVSMVVYRDFPVNKSDGTKYVGINKDRILSRYISFETGQCKAAVPLLVCYTDSQSCADVMLATADCFLTDSLTEENLAAMKSQGIQYVYGQDYVIHYSDDSLKISDLYEKDGICYTSTKE